MDKRKLLNSLTELVEKDLHTAVCAARTAAEGATHEESKAEGAKDTRATEASYLARGQSLRVAELEETLLRLRFMKLPLFTDETPICAGALACIEDENGISRWYFVVTSAGGYNLLENGHSITTITPRSPLGKALIEKLVGDDIELSISGKQQMLEITALQ